MTGTGVPEVGGGPGTGSYTGTVIRESLVVTASFAAKLADKGWRLPG